jgi:mRNA-degrading endonuclease RelE of RelBE toxin-antitoxin system
VPRFYEQKNECSEIVEREDSVTSARPDADLELRGLRRPQYRLRVDDVRVFYDISGATVEILAIVAKSEAESWLAQFGSPK